MKSMKKLGSQVLVKCGIHGKKPWNGEVVCNACGQMFTTYDDKLPTHAPMFCLCNRLLMPPAKNFTARSCCTSCFLERNRS